MISTVTTTTANVTATEIMSYSFIAIVTLIVFLVAKEILSAEAETNPSLNKFVKGANIAIIPLLLVFIAILAFKVLSLL